MREKLFVMKADYKNLWSQNQPIKAIQGEIAMLEQLFKVELRKQMPGNQENDRN